MYSRLTVSLSDLTWSLESLDGLAPSWYHYPLYSREMEDILGIDDCQANYPCGNPIKKCHRLTD